MLISHSGTAQASLCNLVTWYKHGFPQFLVVYSFLVCLAIQAKFVAMIIEITMAMVDVGVRVNEASQTQPNFISEEPPERTREQKSFHFS